MTTSENAPADAAAAKALHGIDLAGKAVVVTGAGMGLGAAVAKAAAACGASVVVNDIDRDLAQRCVDEIRAAGGEAVAHPADISVWAQAEGLIERCLDEFGGIDGLVNNAGLHLPKRSWEMDEASVRRTIDVNVVGTLACAGRAIKAMRAQGSGSIVNTTSGAQCGLDYRPDYGASKGAVSSFTFTAALELAGSGVRVNAMAPNVSTAMLDDMVEFMKERGPWTRPDLPPPEHNVGIHLYLLSDRSRHMSGQILGVRGDGELFIGSHPAILEPTARPDGYWTATAIADVIEAGRLAPMQPLGPTVHLRLATPDAA